MLLLLRECGAGFWRLLLLFSARIACMFSSLFISQKMLGGVIDVHIGARAHTRVDGAPECERGVGGGGGREGVRERESTVYFLRPGGRGGGGRERGMHTRPQQQMNQLYLLLHLSVYCRC